MRRAAVLFFTVFYMFLAVSYALTVRLDDGQLADTAKKVWPDVDFVCDGSGSADIIMVNGIKTKPAEGAYDYTAGIIETLPGSGGMNPYVIYGPVELGAVLENIAEIMGLYEPGSAAVFEKKANIFIKGLKRFEKMRSSKRKPVAVYGETFDYLVNYSGLEKIAVDGYFIYKEKAFRDAIGRVILCDREPGSELAGELKRLGYTLFVVDAAGFGDAAEVIGHILKEMEWATY